MKTAISIPDETFYAAEELAERLRLSRSELYSNAIRHFVDARRSDKIREALDRVYADEPSQVDPVFAQLQALARPTDDEW
jgi:predicted transcriptional regulator